MILLGTAGQIRKSVKHLWSGLNTRRLDCVNLEDAGLRSVGRVAEISANLIRTTTVQATLVAQCLPCIRQWEMLLKQPVVVARRMRTKNQVSGFARILIAVLHTDSVNRANVYSTMRLKAGSAGPTSSAPHQGRSRGSRRKARSDEDRKASCNST